MTAASTTPIATVGVVSPAKTTLPFKGVVAGIR